VSTVLAPSPAPSRSAAPAVRPQPRPGPRPAPRRQPPPRPHLRVVRPEERTLRRLTPAGGIALTVLLFAVLAGLAGAHSLIAQGQIRLDRLDAEVRAEQARYQALRRDVATMEAPERVVAAAEAQGMVIPDDLVYLQPVDPAAAQGDDADTGAGAVAATGSWSTVKPMLETPTP
jgi:hypothetical protein